MDTITVELELSSDQYGQLIALAQARQRSEKEVATIALTEWLESQAGLEQELEIPVLDRQSWNLIEISSVAGDQHPVDR